MSDSDIHEVHEYLEPEQDQPIPWRLIIVALAVLILAVFIVQNFDDVHLEFLWLEFTMPEALVLLLTAGLAAIATLGISAIMRRRKRKRAAAQQPE